jgi:hypothetical protein
MSSTLFEGRDIDGNLFWIDWDGAESIGFWIGDPDGTSQRLDIETSRALVKWFQDNWEVTND